MPPVNFAPSFDANTLPVGTRNPNLQRLRQYQNKNSNDVEGQLADALLGAAPGATATRTRTRVAHNSGNAGDNGGVVKVETQTLINRATTAADRDNLKAVLKSPRRTVATYPADRSGNGGRSFTPGV